MTVRTPPPAPHASFAAPQTGLALFDLRNAERDEKRLARATDPQTSREAVQRHRKSGVMGTHDAIVLEQVRLHPGSTYREIGKHVREAGYEIDDVECMRRLGDMKTQQPMPRVRHGAKRKCWITGHSCVTWWAV